VEIVDCLPFRATSEILEVSLPPVEKTRGTAAPCPRVFTCSPLCWGFPPARAHPHPFLFDFFFLWFRAHFQFRSGRFVLVRPPRTLQCELGVVNPITWPFHVYELFHSNLFLYLGHQAVDQSLSFFPQVKEDESVPPLSFAFFLPHQGFLDPPPPPPQWGG